MLMTRNRTTCPASRTEPRSIAIASQETNMAHLAEIEETDVIVEEMNEKGLPSSTTTGDRFAYWLSQIANPFVVGLAMFGYIALSTAPTMAGGCAGSSSLALV
jgi:hypothetical protein